MNKSVEVKDRLLVIETIECPECHVIQEAEVWWYVGDPWPSYGRECEACGYYIMESVWNEVKP